MTTKFPRVVDKPLIPVHDLYVLLSGTHSKGIRLENDDGCAIIPSLLLEYYELITG